MKESTTERILNDAEAVILAARPRFKKLGDTRRVVRVKIDNEMIHLGVAQTDAEEYKLLEQAMKQYEGRRKVLWSGQIDALKDLAAKVYPNLTRRYVKVRETVLRRMRTKDLRIDELEAIEGWTKRRLARMTDPERAECLKMRKRITARTPK